MTANETGVAHGRMNKNLANHLPVNSWVKIEPHQHYTFTVPKADVKYFDRQSGERIEGKSL